MISSGAEAADRKQRIRDRYKGVDTSELEVIPAKTVEGLGESTSIRRVAAYVRVSTDNDEQTSSYELQKNYYGIGSHDLRGFWVGQENVLSADRKSFSTAATYFV